MRIVLDTNILVSGLLQSKGNPAQVLALALADAVQVCHDQRILAEYKEVLARARFKFDPERIRDVIAKIEEDGLSVDASQQGGLNLPDVDDEPFLAVALAASVDFLVTGNVADYPQERCRGCSVVTPATFMEHWRQLQGGDAPST
jgi:putative PIN family toxin of toxin-antitoxin system